MKNVSLIIAFYLFNACLIAEEMPKVPLVTVTGTHEIIAAPDLIKITVDIDNREKLLQEAKAKTNEQAKKLMDLAKSQQVSRDDIVTSYVAMLPIRNYRKTEGKAISYFQAAQQITIILRDLSKYGSLMDSLVREGFGDVTVVYDLEDMPSYRKKARVNAVLAAQEKAKLLAEAVSQKIGKAYSIKEENISNHYALPNSTANSISRVGASDEWIGKSELTIGNIEIRVSVQVSFCLE
jgi:uncharacterized protein YggE